MGKDRIASARFTQAERDQLSRMADRLGVPLSTLLWRAALCELRGMTPFHASGRSVTIPSMFNIIWTLT